MRLKKWFCVMMRTLCIVSAASPVELNEAIYLFIGGLLNTVGSMLLTWLTVDRLAKELSVAY